ncbi:Serpentine receptor class gamma [Caenorhabditis elegans]|uniref:Serpentine receptor class gamma n=1 Tax=Caenorhabditis elegans TaxID=6239 RepID=Q23228_CAEEL|nr:Serpentine receptor class gamma [Caenorhabditis elegans]CAB01668.3 Serpentine receptor class gamma [Caenorhabditis elegans]|eukprot:NP_506679.3 Serpentine receptor class gamma [Caenorhabditis elegans]
MQIITIFQMIYGVPSFCLMCFFFILIFIDRNNLSNPFYRLVQIDIFVNITCYINTWMSIRLENFEIGMLILIFIQKNIPGFLTVSKLCIGLYFHMQNITGLSLVVYRFTSVHFINSEKHWGRYYLLVPIFGFVYSFLVISPWWIFGNFMAKVDLVDGKLHTTVNPKSLFMHSTINYLFSLFYFLLIILVGVWTTITLQSRGKKSGSIRNQHFVQKLTKVIVCNSVLMSGNLLLLVVLSVFYILFPMQSAVSKFKWIVITFTSDMVTLAMPYLLLAFDSNIRRILRIEKRKHLFLDGVRLRTVTHQAET